tara:strand:+ start:695 stop:1015 length:321 start_codon:yes stop_codon:yes gene_type:complete
MIVKTKFILVVGFIILNLPHFIRADEDDDECVLCDVLIGTAMAICETNESCNAIMTIVALISICILILGCICGDDEARDEIWDSFPSARKTASIGAGYGLAKACMD